MRPHEDPHNNMMLKFGLLADLLWMMPQCRGARSVHSVDRVEEEQKWIADISACVTLTHALHARGLRLRRGQQPKYGGLLCFELDLFSKP
jgi:hypothetical protein